MNALGDEDDGTLKAQRLNVGFSRAMETVEFFISKAPDQFAGEIGRALRHFEQFLEQRDLAELSNQTDPRSKMENEVLQMIFQTRFFLENRERLEIKPGFDLGRYIKQIDPYAQIPNYKVDFLLVYRPSEDEVQQVIVEYDGFEYHFRDRGFVNELTVEELHVEHDVERQKTIESYGYPFIRLNKFVLKRDPFGYIDSKMREVFKKKSPDKFVSDVASLYTAIGNGEIKACAKCGEFRDLRDFYDAKLVTEYGRVCRHCKAGLNLIQQAANSKPGTASERASTVPLCPQCGRKMIRRNWRGSQFWGCPGYPNCRATRRIN